MHALRTPDERFSNLPGYPFAPHYVMVDDTEGGQLRMHYVDEGSPDAPVVLMLHGEPSWSYLYRKMIPSVVAAGFRAVAPDLIGFGRSDKPTERGDYTYLRHVTWVRALLDQLQLEDITLVCQDWGGLIGLRLVGEMPERFARVLAANTMLPTGDHPAGEAFLKWREYSQTVPEFNVGKIIAKAVTCELGADIMAAYDAPFPDDRYKAGARQFPTLVPVTPDDPAAAANRTAWGTLMKFGKPFLTAFSDQDPITAAAAPIIRKLVPGCQGQAHTTIANGGHFLQEDQGEALARVLVDFVRTTA
ncbi:MAG: haloalkane dehalogenase [Rhodocyclaceae bacterium]|nr:haloalkane dehalogenase [Rhodocyclaceae bacterium]MBK6908415.1 haloalkane dehalogenase [Rhodocyclaceae bacterium]